MGGGVGACGFRVKDWGLWFAVRGFCAAVWAWCVEYEPSDFASFDSSCQHCPSEFLQEQCSSDGDPHTKSRGRGDGTCRAMNRRICDHTLRL